ncbi:hypothetical protein [Mahella australiensis]|uniref:hypothetical protein n=1 Tax=Mahella australiensis TaxID=252966 RepID=UPI0002E73B71|nr:hypothetical protein [Mahella australiensis]
MQAIIDFNDPVIAYGLSCPIKFVRLVKKTIKGKTRLYVQLICEGIPYQKEKNYIAEGKIGIDVGPSTVAIVSDTKSSLNLFCHELKDIHGKIRVIQRKMERQRRANNPDNYNSNGTIKRGKLHWHNSKRYLASKAQFTELNRRQAAYRKSLHGQLVNDILRCGNTIYLEDISYKAFQKNFGKSVNYRAPSMFVNMIKTKLLRVQGKFEEFPTVSTALSQMCQCGRRQKKELRVRWHRCECGINMQRDLYSAFLARHVKQNSGGKYYLDLQSATNEWAQIKPVLDEAINNVKMTYNHIPKSFGI